MALKALMLRKRLDGLRSQLKELTDKSEGFKVREEELAKSIEEVTTYEERAAVEEAVTAFENERAENEKAAAGLEEQINGQLQAGFILLELYEDTNGEGRLHQMNIPTFLAMRSRRPL